MGMKTRPGRAAEKTPENPHTQDCAVFWVTAGKENFLDFLWNVPHSLSVNRRIEATGESSNEIVISTVKLYSIQDTDLTTSQLFTHLFLTTVKKKKAK